MKLKVLFSFVLLVGASMAAVLSPRAKSMVDYINNLPGNTWKATENPVIGSFDELERLSGTFESKNRPQLRYHAIANDEDLPDHFDSREQWPECPSLREIRDQGACGSCWAFGAAAAMTDRICIASEGRIQAHISAEDLLSCCDECGNGCHGGYIEEAWKYFKTSGIVTGGQYDSNEGCRPYTIRSCEHFDNKNSTLPRCKKPLAETPECEMKCRDGYETPYESDKHYGINSYSVPRDERQIMKEIMNHGPIEVAFTVYEDFGLYRHGVYRHVAGHSKGGHAVKLIGWGEEDGVPYWLLANSWNPHWGEKGFFRIVRGENHCGIEGRGVAGIPGI